VYDERAFRRGATLFDAGQYFEAHEAWEARWLTTQDTGERLLLQGLIQVAAAFHKLFVMHSAESAERLLSRGLAKLEASDAAIIASFELAAFRRELHACKPDLADTQFDRSRVPRMTPDQPRGC
jgi:hypothetical protein